MTSQTEIRIIVCYWFVSHEPRRRSTSLPFAASVASLEQLKNKQLKIADRNKCFNFIKVSFGFKNLIVRKITHIAAISLPFFHLLSFGFFTFLLTDVKDAPLSAFFINLVL